MATVDYIQVLETLRRRGVSFAVLRGADRLGRGERPEDVDLLVADADLAAFRAIMGELGFWLWEYAQPHQEMWTTLSLPGLRTVTLDRKPSPFPVGVRPASFTSGEVIRDARPGPAGLPVPSPTHAFWTLLVHVLVNRSPGERERYLPELRRLAGAGAEALPSGLGPEEALAGVPGPAEEILPRLGLEYEPPREVRVPRRGRTVALVGPDGSGKSTLAAGLEDVLPYTRRIYMGLRDFVLPTSRWFHRERTPPAEGSGGGGSPGERSVRERLGYTAYMLNHHLEFLARRAKGEVWKRRGRVVLFDRYYYDVLDLAEDSAEAHLRPLFVRAFPTPDLLVLLRPPVEVMLERKDERSPAYYRRFYGLYDRLLDEIGGRMEVLTLDTSGPLERSVREVAVAVERARTWRSVEELP